MATSKVLTKNCAYGSVSLSLVRTGYDVSSLTSYWKATLSTYCSGTIKASAEKPYSFKVNGTEYSGTFVFGSSFTGTKTIRTVEKIAVKHNADGGKSFDISFEVSPKITYSGKWVDPVTASSTVEADSILLLGKVSFKSTANVTLFGASVGRELVVGVANASTAYRYKLTYSIGTETGCFHTTEYMASAATVNWIVPDSFLNQITSTQTGVLKATCETYNGSTLLGTENVNLTITIPTDERPVITQIVVSQATTDIADRFGIFVQKHSKLQVTTSAEASIGTAIAKTEVTVNGKTYTGEEIITDVITTAGELEIKVVVYDARGYTTKETTSVNIVAYSPPFFPASLKSAYRSVWNLDEEGNRTTLKEEKQEGTFLYAYCAAFACALTDGGTHHKNFPTIHVEYKETDSDTWTLLKTFEPDLNAVIDGEQTFLNATFRDETEGDTGILDISTAYLVRFTATDFFTKSNPPRVTIPIPVGFSIIDVSDTGKGVAFFKMSEKDGVEVNAPSYFYGSMEKNGINIPDIQSGSVKVTASSLENNVYVGNETVEFDFAFKSVPKIFVTAWTAAPGSYFVEASVTDVTKTGFQVHVGRKDADTETGIYWLAVALEEQEV